MELHVYPLLFKPVYKHMIWGGKRISPDTENNHEGLPVGESWMISDREGAQTVVVNGPHKGLELRTLVESFPGKIVGSRHRPSDGFPLLIKLIDAKERLSLQVHPDEISAAKFGGECKNEMWYMLDNEPGAKIYAGLRHDKTQLQFRTRIGTDKLEECLQTFKSRKGDAYYIPSGTVHSIGGGNFILEIQQNSDTTYRIYDWGRVGADGESRTLMVEEALHAVHFKDRGLPLIRCDERPVTANKKRNLVGHNKYFVAEELKIVSDFFSNTSTKSFHVLVAVDTAFTLKYSEGEIQVPKESCCLLPAALGSYSIPSQDKAITIIRSKLSM